MLIRAKHIHCVFYVLSTITLGGSEPPRAEPSRAEPSRAEPSRERSAPESILFEKMPRVETAALYTQTLKEAPANVTVITAEQIRLYGYRTLAEALSDVRGFHFTWDGAVQFAGVRGFGLPGDYNTRILVMVNGHFLTDNVFGAMYMFGHDFGIDMDLIQRIEVVRGPSSALYGSNGVLATVNIFTRTPVDSPAGTASVQADTLGFKKMNASTSMYFGHGVNLLLSGSSMLSRGWRLSAAPFGEFPGGQTGGLGAEQGFTTFAHLTYKDWSFLASFGDHKQSVPLGWYGAVFGDRGTGSSDVHNFAEAMWTHEAGRETNIRWRVYYDQYRYFGRYDNPSADGVVDERDDALGDWIGTQLTVRTPLPSGTLAVGGQVDADIRNQQRTYLKNTPLAPYRNVSALDTAYGLFMQQEWKLPANWTAFLGLRLDDSKVHRPFLSPRAALIYQPSEHASYKFLYGRAFRNPSSFERFWEPNPLLQAERIHTYEFSTERKLARNMDLVGTVFHYRLTGLIEGVPVSDSVLQYRNLADSRATGAEFELSRDLADRLRLTGAFSWTRARYSAPSRDLPNSPTRLIQLRAAAPLIRKHLAIAAAARYMSSRATPYGWRVPGFTIADITLTTERLTRDFDVQFGIRNLAGTRYGDPLSEEHLPALLPRAGRSMFVKLLWRPGDSR